MLPNKKVIFVYVLFNNLYLYHINYNWNIIMPFIYKETIEIRETNLHQEPDMKAGERYIDDMGRFCEVKEVRFIKYVWEDVSQWEIATEKYSRDELTESEMSKWLNDN